MSGASANEATDRDRPLVPLYVDDVLRRVCTVSYFCYDDGMTKQRVTITADAEALAVGQQLVADGVYASLSEWANAAMVEKIARDARLRALDDALTAYEAEHGAITDAEVAAQMRADREAAIVVRGHRVAAGAA